jgi:integrase
MILIRTVDLRHRAKYVGEAHLELVTPATVKRTVTPRRPPNAKLRTREYMTEAEVERLMAAARGNRYGHRDATMALVAHRRGLRASELVDLRVWEQVDYRTGTLAVRRVKKGTPSTHPILGDELRVLRRLQREQEPTASFSSSGCIRGAAQVSACGAEFASSDEDKRLAWLGIPKRRRPSAHGLPSLGKR